MNKHKEAIYKFTPDLNWIVSTTIEAVVDATGERDLRSMMSKEELVRLMDELDALVVDENTEVDILKARTHDQLSEIRDFTNVHYLRNILRKVNVLFETASSDSGADRRNALKALKYLAENNDVVHDDLGFLGLVDDIYVIEWAFALIRRETLWLPLQEEMMQRWPFVGQLVIRSGTRRIVLDRYSRHIVCNSLQYIEDHHREVTLIVLRENGPFPFIVATVSAMGLHLRKRFATSDGRPTLIEGQDIILFGQDKRSS